jgi:phosphopantothenoylcysteine decarboxylase/phosphopantothenate--cysteine ligase
MKDKDVEPLGKHLENKKIGLFVTSGIAAYKCPSLIRHFRQYGADVQVYTTPESEKIVTKEVLQWTSLHPVISELSSDAEHLREYDAYVVAPATLNTIGKMAVGIADNAVTSTLASALGRLRKDKKHPVIVAPAMHGTLEDNPFYEENVGKLKSCGVKFIDPVHKWGKANFPGSHDIVAPTIRELSQSPLKNKSILITAGPTPVWIDNVRYITNKFRGRLGIEIAEEAYMRGADVKLIMGRGGLEVPRYIDTKNVNSFKEYYDAVFDSLCSKDFDFSIFSAAVADYAPTKVYEGKIPSKGAIESIPLENTPKVIKEVRKRFPRLFMTTFKYEERVTPEELEVIAKNRIGEGYQMVVANRGEELTEKEHHSIIVDETGVIARPTTKTENAKMILDALEKKSY